MLSTKQTGLLLLLILSRYFFFTGTDECKDNPCKNGGSCVNSPPGSYSCNCTKGYKGKTCEEGRISAEF